MTTSLIKNNEITFLTIENDDLPKVQAVFDACPNFHKTVVYESPENIAEKCFNNQLTSEFKTKVFKYFLAIQSNDNADFIGIIDLYVGYPKYNIANIATFIIRENMQKKSFATNALKLLLQFLRKKHPAVEKLVVTVTDNNIPANRLLKKLKFQKTNYWRKIQKNNCELIAHSSYIDIKTYPLDELL